MLEYCQAAAALARSRHIPRASRRVRPADHPGACRLNGTGAAEALGRTRPTGSSPRQRPGPSSRRGATPCGLVHARRHVAGPAAPRAIEVAPPAPLCSPQGRRGAPRVPVIPGPRSGVRARGRRRPLASARRSGRDARGARRRAGVVGARHLPLPPGAALPAGRRLALRRRGAGPGGDLRRAQPRAAGGAGRGARLDRTGGARRGRGAAGPAALGGRGAGGHAGPISCSPSSPPRAIGSRPCSSCASRSASSPTLQRPGRRRIPTRGGSWPACISSSGTSRLPIGRSTIWQPTHRPTALPPARPDAGCSSGTGPGGRSTTSGGPCKPPRTTCRPGASSRAPTRTWAARRR